IGGLAGGIGSKVQQEASVVEVGLAMNAADSAAVVETADKLRGDMGGYIPTLVVLDEATAKEPPKVILQEKRGNYAAIISGTREAPVITAPEGQIDRWRGPVGLIAATSMGNSPKAFPAIKSEIVATSGADIKRSRVQTAQVGQMLLFLLTMLLGGMVLSNLVEEKGNKIIEVLAAAIPMDAVFLGKLFAMLGVSFVGIMVWGLTGSAIFALGGFSSASFAAPAVGWPLFFTLGVVYFAMGYLILGSLFLAIGSMAATVRDVQMMSMPVTMLQLLVFFFATYAMSRPGSPMELAATIVPFSSPFAMLARAAQVESLWPHALAIAWQAAAVAVFVKVGASLFKKRVMKSGPQGVKAGKRSFWRRRTKVQA
ncbi:MAG: ABC transporter permease, partial [Pontixanthobacter sp.]